MPYYRYQNSNYLRPSLFGGFRYFPPVIKYLLIANVAIFLLADFISMFRIEGLPLAPLVNYIFALYPLGEGFHVWQLVTYMFMHGGFMHLFMNMFALWMFGMQLENDWGSRKFLTYYLMCGIGAGLSNLLIGPIFGSAGPTVGASGAIYGVLLAFGMLYPDTPIFIYFLLPIRAKYFVIFYILIEVYAGVTGTADGVAHFAHLGGAAVGFVYLMVDRKRLPFKNVWSRAKQRLAHSEYAVHTHRDVSDANYYELHNDEDGVSQQQIDEILDKISQHGYQSLTEDEKKILFAASKKLN